MKSILNQYHKRINILEGEKYDLEYEVAKKDMEVEKDFFRGKQRESATLRLTPFQYFFTRGAYYLSLYLATVPTCAIIIIRRRRRG